MLSIEQNWATGQAWNFRFGGQASYNVKVLKNLAAAYQAQGAGEEAQKYWEKALVIQPEDVESLYGLALLIYEEGN